MYPVEDPIQFMSTLKNAVLSDLSEFAYLLLGPLHAEQAASFFERKALAVLKGQLFAVAIEIAVLEEFIPEFMSNPEWFGCKIESIPYGMRDFLTNRQHLIDSIQIGSKILLKRNVLQTLSAPLHDFLIDRTRGLVALSEKAKADFLVMVYQRLEHFFNRAIKRVFASTLFTKGGVHLNDLRQYGALKRGFYAAKKHLQKLFLSAKTFSQLLESVFHDHMYLEQTYKEKQLKYYQLKEAIETIKAAARNCYDERFARAKEYVLSIESNTAEDPFFPNGYISSAAASRWDNLEKRKIWPSLDALFERNQTLLHFSVNSPVLFHYLLSANADPFVRSDFNESPIEAIRNLPDVDKKIILLNALPDFFGDLERHYFVYVQSRSVISKKLSHEGRTMNFPNTDGCFDQSGSILDFSKVNHEGDFIHVKLAHIPFSNFHKRLLNLISSDKAKRGENFDWLLKIFCEKSEKQRDNEENILQSLIFYMILQYPKNNPVFLLDCVMTLSRYAKINGYESRKLLERLQTELVIISSDLLVNDKHDLNEKTILAMQAQISALEGENSAMAESIKALIESKKTLEESIQVLLSAKTAAEGEIKILGDALVQLNSEQAVKMTQVKASLELELRTKIQQEIQADLFQAVSDTQGNSVGRTPVHQTLSAPGGADKSVTGTWFSSAVSSLFQKRASAITIDAASAKPTVQHSL